MQCLRGIQYGIVSPVNAEDTVFTVTVNAAVLPVNSVLLKLISIDAVLLLKVGHPFSVAEIVMRLLSAGSTGPYCALLAVKVHSSMYRISPFAKIAPALLPRKKVHDISDVLIQL